METVGLADLLNGGSGTTIKVRVTTREGDVFEILTRHTMSSDQLNWLRAGSALNHIRSKMN